MAARLLVLSLSALSLVVVTAVGQADGSDAAAVPASAARELLTEPYLQLPEEDSVNVTWMTEFEGRSHVVLVGERVDELNSGQLRAAAGGARISGIDVFPADTAKLSQMAEDAASAIPDAPDEVTPRDVYRHEATVTGLEPGVRIPYRVVSLARTRPVASDTYTLTPSPRNGDDLKILLTSDHQLKANTPANLQQVAETVGQVDAVFLAGDLVNVPDRASEWFDDQRGFAFFPALQGRASYEANGVEYAGAEIIQNAPLFPAVGNHEVMGRAGRGSLNESFNSPVPRAVAEAEYARIADEINPTGDERLKEQWITDNSFNTTSYEELFTLPDSSPGGERYYATTVGDVRLISLYSTRIWRSPNIAADQSSWDRTRFTEAPHTLDDPLAQGWGSHIFEEIGVGSEQYEWLRAELAGSEFRDAEYAVVMLHEGPHGLGDNMSPPFTDPVRIEEVGENGEPRVRYEYPKEDNYLTRDVAPLLEEAGVNLVLNGHSHLWNRFVAPSGTNYLETSNVGNSYGAYHPLSGLSRPVPPAPWNADNYSAQGNPGGLEPVVPSVHALTNDDGASLPFAAGNEFTVFSILDTGAGEVVSYLYDLRTPEAAPVVMDRFKL
ncbi:metallophosphoesterase family protein [Phytoactinopolyspora halotolerans]|uniref:Metallophosphoesterase n=1 Tax=Phytoactinopolyspora halotolerans TaxID=1981512 RepID=A0A6L9SDP7_9ACTN|nr:metallophosphoesterase [Phytoactinopolyspora halotolerans]NEE03406.1 metallophosphoesterase [Phytoactinopolyspora halotolerans]